MVFNHKLEFKDSLRKLIVIAKLLTELMILINRMLPLNKTNKCDLSFDYYSPLRQKDKSFLNRHR